jgi:cyclic beta-1,2-glucan synthetase
MLTSAGGGYSRRRGLAVTRWREDPTAMRGGSSSMCATCTAGGSGRRRTSPSDRADRGYIGVLLPHRPRGVSPRRPTASRPAWSSPSPRRTTPRCARVKLTNQRPGRASSSSRATSRSSSPRLRRRRAPGLRQALRRDRVRAASGALIARGARARPSDPRSVGRPRVRRRPTESAGAGRARDRPLALPRARAATRHPARHGRRPLSGSTGAVLDPVFSLRSARAHRLRASRAAAVHDGGRRHPRGRAALAEKYADPVAANAPFALAWTHAQSQLHYLGIGVDEAQLFERLGSRALSRRDLRCPRILTSSRATAGASRACGPTAISGDLPIVLVRVGGEEHIELVREALHAHEYWRIRGLTVDLVVLNEHPPSYLQAFQDAAHGHGALRPGGSSSTSRAASSCAAPTSCPSEDQIVLLRPLARAVRSWWAPAGRSRSRSTAGPRARAAAAAGPSILVARARTLLLLALPPLLFSNALGGFSADGREYVIRLGPKQWTPAPWVQRARQRGFGALVSEPAPGTSGRRTATRTASPSGPTTRSRDPATGGDLRARRRDSGA